MKRLYDPYKYNEYQEKYEEEMKKCGVCPFCGNDDNFYGIQLLAKKLPKGIRPHSYRITFTNKSDNIIKRIKETMDDTIYRIYNFSCPKCGGEWESEPVKVINSKGEIIVNDKIRRKKMKAGKMTDYERTIQFLNDMRIEYEEREDDKNKTKVIELTGYKSIDQIFHGVFYFEFNANGEFKEMTALG